LNAISSEAIKMRRILVIVRKRSQTNFRCDSGGIIGNLAREAFNRFEPSILKQQALNVPR
jgi:hypothetical protein